MASELEMTAAGREYLARLLQVEARKPRPRPYEAEILLDAEHAKLVQKIRQVQGLRTLNQYKRSS
ncbi:MAG: hypothetical protein L0312_26765 [Acidobacteria bacterium]|nr:hypothetical protein [Acidobacteriota bacterium]